MSVSQCVRILAFVDVCVGRVFCLSVSRFVRLFPLCVFVVFVSCVSVFVFVSVCLSVCLFFCFKDYMLWQLCY